MAAGTLRPCSYRQPPFRLVVAVAAGDTGPETATRTSCHHGSSSRKWRALFIVDSSGTGRRLRARCGRRSRSGPHPVAEDPAAAGI